MTMDMTDDAAAMSDADLKCIAAISDAQVLAFYREVAPTEVTAAQLLAAVIVDRDAARLELERRGLTHPVPATVTESAT